MTTYYGDERDVDLDYQDPPPEAEAGCLYPDKGLMPGLHRVSECHTVEMMEVIEQEAKGNVELPCNYDLLHCPFCGSEALHLFWNDPYRSVTCDKCHAEGPVRDNMDFAVEAWNTRRTPIPEDER